MARLAPADTNRASVPPARSHRSSLACMGSDLRRAAPERRAMARPPAASAPGPTACARPREARRAHADHAAPDARHLPPAATRGWIPPTARRLGVPRQSCTAREIQRQRQRRRRRRRSPARRRRCPPVDVILNVRWADRRRVHHQQRTLAACAHGKVAVRKTQEGHVTAPTKSVTVQPNVRRESAAGAARGAAQHAEQTAQRMCAPPEAAVPIPHAHGTAVRKCHARINDHAHAPSGDRADPRRAREARWRTDGHRRPRRPSPRARPRCRAPTCAKRARFRAEPGATRSPQRQCGHASVRLQSPARGPVEPADHQARGRDRDASRRCACAPPARPSPHAVCGGRAVHR